MSLFFNRSSNIPRSGYTLRETRVVSNHRDRRTCYLSNPFLYEPGQTLLIVTDKSLMTIIQQSSEMQAEAKDRSQPKEAPGGGKSSRPVRNRRYTRRSIVAGQRPQKRLFTPELKRYLKDWLVRRRENPYPNKEEKKYLSRETGLTYIQICNWFANWRRKLKNVNPVTNQPTWGHLIRTYNDRAQGNVEQFSICSDDSIWSEPEPGQESLEVDTDYAESPDQSAEFHPESDASSHSKDDIFSFNMNNNMYSPVIDTVSVSEQSKSINSPMLLSKWLESAARFQPSDSNYSWWGENKRRKQEPKLPKINYSLHTSRHDRDEVEAAMALTTLASAASRVTAP